MNLIDRYIAEVGKHLPRKQRADIEAEIRSTLEDMLEERNQAGGPVSEAMIVELLKDYGKPEKVAESYLGEQHLIGPRMYPMFELIVKIVMASLLGAGLLGFGVSGAIYESFSGPDFLSFLAEFWVDMIGGMFGAFGALVITFAILERVLPASEFEKDDEKEWDPAELAKEPDPDQVKISESIATIIFTIAGLIIFNLYPNLVGFAFNTDGKWAYVPVLSDAFFTYLPWINLLGVLEIGFNVYQLRQRVWTTFTRLCNMVLEIGTILLAGAMLTGPSLVALNTEKLTDTSLIEAAEIVAKILGFVPGLVLIIVIIISAIEVAQTAYRLMKNRTSSPYPVVK